MESVSLSVLPQLSRSFVVSTVYKFILYFIIVAISLVDVKYGMRDFNIETPVMDGNLSVTRQK